MTSKELAEELFNKMYDAFANDEEDHWEQTVIRISKKCAIAAIDYIQSNTDQSDDFYIDFKNEIENIEEPINTEINESSTDL
jgi:hypothetical protein